MFFILLLLGFWLGTRLFECVKAYKSAKQTGTITRYDRITLWGWGLGFSTVAMMELCIIMFVMYWFSVGAFDIIFEILCTITAFLGYLVLPFALYIFTGVVHFATIKPYRANELTHLEDKMHKTSGIVFYILTVLIIWVVVSLVRAFNGEISYM